MIRFDDLVRSERYYTATLLPALLMHQDFTGLQRFCELVDAKAPKIGGRVTCYDDEGRATEATPQQTPLVVNANTVELITEFHIARDLAFADLLQLETEPTGDGDVEQPSREAPDLVIVVGDQLIVCEGKFFGACNLRALNAQLHSQRQQICHLFKQRSLRPYRHVALLPLTFEPHPACTAVVTWDDVATLAADVLGDDHYVSRRVHQAVRRYNDQQLAPPDPFIDGVLLWHEVLGKCEELGDLVQIGCLGGEKALLEKGADELRRRPWRWRYINNSGNVYPRNWIAGSRFLRLIAPHRLQQPFGGEDIT